MTPTLKTVSTGVFCPLFPISSVGSWAFQQSEHLHKTIVDKQFGGLQGPLELVICGFTEYFRRAEQWAATIASQFFIVCVWGGV